MDNLELSKVIGTAFVGALGFAVGFYAGFFSILAIWGFQFESVLFPIITGGLASAVAGLGMAFTVPSDSRLKTILTTIGLGVVLIAVIGILNADVGAMAVGGLIVVIIAAIVARTQPEKA